MGTSKKTGLAIAITLSLILPAFLAMTPKASASTTLNSIADSWVENKYPTLNHGTNVTLHSRCDTHPYFGNMTKRSYLKFNLSGIDPDTIHNATLYMYCTVQNGTTLMDVDLHKTWDNWTEYDISWDDAPPIGDRITTTAVDGVGQWYSWGGDAMKNYVKAEAAGDGIVSFVAKLPNDTVYIHPQLWHVDFSSKEGSYPPYLKIFEHPVACFTVSNYRPNTGENVTFNASCSYDPDGVIAKYEWDWEGDCTYDFDAGTNPIATHVYTMHGLYYPKLRVTDDEGLTDVINTTILVRGHPVANFTWTPPTPNALQTVTFNASASTPDGGYIMNYTWNFGDSPLNVTETDPIITHVYTNPGTYTVTLLVNDSEEKSDTESKQITVLQAAGGHMVPITIAEGSHLPAIPIDLISALIVAMAVTTILIRRERNRATKTPKVRSL